MTTEGGPIAIELVHSGGPAAAIEADSVAEAGRGTISSRGRPPTTGPSSTTTSGARPAT